MRDEKPCDAYLCGNCGYEVVHRVTGALPPEEAEKLRARVSELDAAMKEPGGCFNIAEHYGGFLAPEPARRLVEALMALRNIRGSFFGDGFDCWCPCGPTELGMHDKWCVMARGALADPAVKALK